MASKPKLGGALDRTEDGRLARPTVPDPRKIGTRLSQRLLPQVLSASIKLRKTARPR
jgi:hypothetical protein